MKMRVNADTLRDMQSQRERINGANLSEIELYEDGLGVLHLFPEDIAEWKVTGLSNIDFLNNRLGIGHSVVVVTMGKKQQERIGA